MDEVVLVMAEGDLVAAEFLGEVEEQLAAVPGAEEAGLLLFAQAGGGLRMSRMYRMFRIVRMFWGVR